jgi:hypothetical protein
MTRPPAATRTALGVLGNERCRPLQAATGHCLLLSVELDEQEFDLGQQRAAGALNRSAAFRAGFEYEHAPVAGVRLALH